jgi:hypothetical protein
MTKKDWESMDNDEIDLIELMKVIWSKRRLISMVTGVFLILGLVIVLTLNNQYKAVSKILPDNNENSMGGLGGLSGLAGLAGINLNLGSSGSISPQLYPEIVDKIKFQISLINYPIYFQSLDTTISCSEYFKEVKHENWLNVLLKYTLGLPGQIKRVIINDNYEGYNYPKDTSLLSMSKEDWDLHLAFRDRQIVFMDVETGIIYVSIELPDRYAAAELNKFMIAELTREITNYKIQKVSSDLTFIKERYNEAKLRYENQQEIFATFTDKNRNSSSGLIQVEFQRIQNELNIAYELYKGLSSQLEQALIKVKETTPVFTILEPAMIPVEKNSPKRLLILMLITASGFFFTLGYVFLVFLIERKNELANHKG